jgi:hypothetical protein
METNEMTFPAYRKYVGIPVWFKILTERKFIEVKKVGNRFVLHEVDANQYPEMVLIKDMLLCHEGRWEESDSASFNTAYSQV